MDQCIKHQLLASICTLIIILTFVTILPKISLLLSYYTYDCVINIYTYILFFNNLL